MGNDRSLASGLLAAVILWALVLIGLLAPPPPKPHGPAGGWRSVVRRE